MRARTARDLVVELGLLDQSGLQLIGRGERFGASLLVSVDHAGDVSRVALGELFADVQDAVRVPLGLAKEQHRTTLELARRHQWVEACPGVHVTALESSLAVRMLQLHELHVLLREARRIQRAQQENREDQYRG